MRNPPGTPGFSMPNAARHRRMVNLTLSEQAKELLDQAREASGLSRSAIVDELICKYIEKTSVNKKSTSKIK